MTDPSAWETREELLRSTAIDSKSVVYWRTSLANEMPELSKPEGASEPIIDPWFDARLQDQRNSPMQMAYAVMDLCQCQTGMNTRQCFLPAFSRSANIHI